MMAKWPALVLALWAVDAEAQQRPDLSGTWVATKDVPRTLPPAPGAILGQQFALKQDGETIAVTRRVRDAIVTATYTIGGREVRTRIPGALCMADSESVERAAWEGDGLALTIVGSVPPGGTGASKLNIKRVLRLDGPDTLVVQGSIRDKAQADPRSVGTVYRRSPDVMKETAAPEPPNTPATIAQVAWMAGVWTGGSGSDERWTPPASGSMFAVSRTLRDGVLSAFEYLCITQRGGSLVYQAMPNARSPATDFMLTRIEPTSATFENPAHDFPKMIRYTLLGDGTLEAVVGGDPGQRALTFTFKRNRE
jgi:hypothetical protein